MTKGIFVALFSFYFIRSSRRLKKTNLSSLAKFSEFEMILFTQNRKYLHKCTTTPRWTTEVNQQMNLYQQINNESHFFYFYFCILIDD